MGIHTRKRVDGNDIVLGSGDNEAGAGNRKPTSELGRTPMVNIREPVINLVNDTRRNAIARTRPLNKQRWLEMVLLVHHLLIHCPAGE